MDEIEKVDNGLENDTPKIDYAEEIKKVNEELVVLKNNFSTKLYTIRGGKEYAKSLRNWLINEAEWNYSECYAILKLVDAVDIGLGRIDTKECKEFKLLNVEMSALNVLFQKTKGKGFHQAKKFHDILKPIIDVLSTEVKKDSELINRHEFKLSSYMEGIEPAPEVMDGLPEVEEKTE